MPLLITQYCFLILIIKMVTYIHYMEVQFSIFSLISISIKLLSISKSTYPLGIWSKGFSIGTLTAGDFNGLLGQIFLEVKFLAFDNNWSTWFCKGLICCSIHSSAVKWSKYCPTEKKQKIIDRGNTRSVTSWLYKFW